MPAVAVVAQSGDEFSPIDLGAMEFFYWTFAKKLKPGETILSAVVTATSVVDGSDNSTAMVLGVPSVFNGTVVKQMIVGVAPLGVRYRLTAEATTTLGQVIPLSGIVRVGPEYGVVQ